MPYIIDEEDTQVVVDTSIIPKTIGDLHDKYKIELKEGY